MGRAAKFRKDLSMPWMLAEMRREHPHLPLVTSKEAEWQGKTHFSWVTDLRAMFLGYQLPDWETFCRALTFGCRVPVPVPFDTSRPRHRAGRRPDRLVLRGTASLPTPSGCLRMHGLAHLSRCTQRQTGSTNPAHLAEIAASTARLHRKSELSCYRGTV